MLLFFTSQIVGLYLLNISIESVQETEEGITVTYSEPITGRPELEGQASFNYLVIMVLIGTALLLLLIRFRLFKVWKAWFFFAIWGALSISFSVFLKDTTASIIAFLLAYLKTYKGNAIVHNLTEIFIYPGIAIMLSPIFTVYWAIMLLIVISVYDMIAVWKSKHMVKMAKFQTESNMFAGLTIPKSGSLPKLSSKSKKVSTKASTDSVAIVGGGDIGFPLLFAGAAMAQFGFEKAFIIPIFAALGLAFLFYISKKGKFYPAMPFISVGCFIGYGIVYFLP